MSHPGPSTAGHTSAGPSLDGLRRALAPDQTFARVRAEAARGFDVRGQDYQISAPAGAVAAMPSAISARSTGRSPAGALIW
jgi:transcription-repair coupling factor (superfamily II helicase)